MSSEPLHVEVYLRSLAPATGREPQDAIVETLQRLEANGQVERVEVTVCGKCVCPSLATAESEIGQRLLDRYRAFEMWADTSGRELVGFEARDVTSLVTDTAVTGIVFPQCTLAEYRGGELTFVAPSTNGTEQTTVADRIQQYGPDDFCEAVAGNLFCQ